MKMEINEQEITFNIRYDMHQDDWKELADVLKLLPGFISVEKTGDFFWLIATKRLEAPKPTRLPKIIAKINPLSIL